MPKEGKDRGADDKVSRGKKKREGLVFIVFLLVLSILGTAFLVWYYVAWRQRARAIRNSPLVTATVTEFEAIPASGGKAGAECRITYEYTAPDGQPCRSERRFSLKKPSAESKLEETVVNGVTFKLGAKIEVYLDPRDPQKSIPKALVKPMPPATGLIFGVVLLWFMTSLNFINYRRKSSR